MDERVFFRLPSGFPYARLWVSWLSTQRGIVIIALHSKRNRPYLYTLVFMLFVSWISLIISETCTMSSALITTSDHMQGCSESGVPVHSQHQDHASKSMQNCSFKPCLETQSDSFIDFNRLNRLDFPVLMGSLIWTFWCLFLTLPPTKVSCKTDPPLGRRILLIYRFCTLLN